MKSPEEIADIIDNCKQIGCQCVEIDGIKYHIAREVAQHKGTLVPDLPPEDLMKPMSVFDEMTEEEIMNWHTGYYDLLQEQKAAHAEKLKNEVKNG